MVNLNCDVMRKFLAIATIISAIIIGCSTEVRYESSTPKPSPYKALTAHFGEETRTYVEQDKYILWHEDDLLTVFYGDDVNNKYKFEGETGDNGGTFTVVDGSTSDATTPLDRIYAIYPYDADATISSSGEIGYHLAATQSYAKDSFGVGANTMVAATESVDDTDLYFSNLCGYLKIKLYGNILVKSIELSGNSGEKIAGLATITASNDAQPTITMSDEATESILLDCGDGVAAGHKAESATTFWFVVPPTTFAEGITVTITSTSDEVFEKSTNKPVVIERNTIQPMAAFEVVGECNEVEYIANIFDPIFDSCASMKELAPYVAQLKDLYGVAEVYADDESVCAVLESGIVMAWTFAEISYSEKYDAEATCQATMDYVATRSSAEHNYIGEDVGGKLKVGIFNQTTKGWFNFYYNDIKKQFNELANEFRDAGFEVEIKECEDLTYDFYADEFFDYDIILWHTHGVKLPGFPQRWYMGAPYDGELRWSDSAVRNGNIGVIKGGMMDGGPYQMVSHQFFNESKKTFENETLIFAAACGSLEDKEHAVYNDVFKDKNVVTYLGYDATVKKSGYTACEIFRYMLGGMTIKEAYDRSEEKLDDGANIILLGDGDLCIVHPSVTTSYPIVDDGVVTMSGEVSGWNEKICGDIGFVWTTQSSYEDIEYELTIENCVGQTVVYSDDDPKPNTSFTFTTTEPQPNAQSPFTSGQLYMCRAYAKVHDEYIYGEARPFVVDGGNNIIYYETTDENITGPTAGGKVGNANVLSNTYDGGIGLIVCDVDITRLAREFKSDELLKSIVLPDSITSIEYEAFYQCYALESVSLPSTLTSIGKNAFRNCSSLTSIVIPGSVKTLGTDSFKSCSSLKSVVLEDGVKSLGDGTFAGTTNLENISLPNSLETIGGWAFGYSQSLKHIVIPESVKTIGNEAFEFCTSLESIDLPYGITSISNSTFEGCSSLKEITIPDSVKTIGDCAFRTCNALEKLSLPSTLISIGYDCFLECRGLTELHIPNSVTSIGRYAFCGCDQLTKVKLSNSLTTINEYTFAHCKSLQSIDIPNSVTKLGQYCFGYCSNLTTAKIGSGVITLENDVFRENSSLESVEMGGNVTSLGGGAFNGCISLKNINIPNSVTTIANRVFGNCSSLENIEIPNGVITIGDNVFNGCTSLKSITIPDSVTSLGSNVFAGCTGIEYLRWGGGIKNVPSNIFKDNKNLKEVVIAEGVTTIAASALRDCPALENVQLPSTLTSIGDYAFNDCISLKNITIPDSVTSIGQYAFCGCNQLTKVKLSNSLTAINYYTFAHCAALQSVEIPDSVTTIESCAFYNCSSIQRLELSDSVTSLGINVFTGCTGIEYLRWGSGIKNVPSNICKDNKSLKEVVFGEGVTSIGDSAFYNCTALARLTIPDSVTSIGGFAFYDCVSLKNITIPDSVTSIGGYAFCGCNQLTMVKLSNSLTTINTSTFANCSALQSIEIPDSVTSIGNSAFAECTSLTDFNIPSNITHIGGAAFQNCSGPRVITIPASVVTLRTHAFEYPNLEEVHCKPIDIPAGCASASGSTFGFRNITVYVPKESYSKYRDINSWRYYTIIGE